MAGPAPRPTFARPWAFRFGEIAVAALIASVLASAAMPRVLAARERAAVALATSRMKSTAIAIESYFVDHEAFPASGCAAGAAREYESQQLWQPKKLAAIPAGVATANSFARQERGAAREVTFALETASGAALATITTPVAYLARFEEDPFASSGGASFGYFSHGSNLGWILFSFGPDRDENSANGPGDISPRVERLYDLSSQFPYMWEPSGALISAGYDPTNGAGSDGDLYWLGGN